MDEFELISRYFDRDDRSQSVLAGIGDDGAVLRPDRSCDQVQVIDTLVAGTHFPENTAPADIGWRSVAVNLSDIAAMGAVPRWMTLALTLPHSDANWIREFARGLFAVADQYGVELVGGDTTSGPVTTVSIAMTGEVEQGAALLRSGAQPGDAIFVSGTLGDAAAGLRCLEGERSEPFLEQRFLRPTPRTAIGRALVGKATAAIDLSDGLAGDLAKMLSASAVAADIHLESLPISAALSQYAEAAQQYEFALTGGDDYELCFAADPGRVASIAGITNIGTVTDGEGLVARLHGDIVDVDASGYRHFS